MHATMGRALHARLKELDDTDTAYTVAIPGILSKHCSVYEHGPQHLVVTEYDEHGNSVSHFINLERVSSVELELC